MLLLVEVLLVLFNLILIHIHIHIYIYIHRYNLIFISTFKNVLGDVTIDSHKLTILSSIFKYLASFYSFKCCHRGIPRIKSKGMCRISYKRRARNRFQIFANIYSV